ncbi:hypothetical protein GCM10010219_28900 [Streptomyces netropsis]|nr:hypothetical protein GCM10010219_28900 [Streptomyces netropsis]
MTDPSAQSPPEWISEILDRWVPPDDYDIRLNAVVDGYLAHQARAITPPDRLSPPQPA